MNNEEVEATAQAFNQLKEVLGEEYEIVLGNEEALKEQLLSLSDLNPAIRDNIDLIIENTDKFAGLADSIEDADNAAAMYAKEMFKNVIQDKYGTQIDSLATKTDANGNSYVDKGRSELITTIVANSADKENDKMAKELKNIDVSNASSNDKLNKNYGYDIKNDEDLARTYAEKVLGYSAADASKLTYKGGSNKGTLKDKSGKAIIEGYSDDFMREELAYAAKEAEILKKYKDKLEGQGALDNVSDVIKSGTEIGAKYGTDFTDAFLQTMANGDKKIDLSSTFAELNPEQVQSITGLENPEDVASMIGMSQETLEAMGYANAKEFGEAFKQGLSTYE